MVESLGRFCRVEVWGTLMNKRESKHRINLFDTQKAFIGELEVSRTELPVVVSWADCIFVRHSEPKAGTYYESRSRIPDTRSFPYARPIGLVGRDQNGH